MSPIIRPWTGAGRLPELCTFVCLVAGCHQSFRSPVALVPICPVHDLEMTRQGGSHR